MLWYYELYLYIEFYYKIWWCYDKYYLMTTTQFSCSPYIIICFSICSCWLSISQDRLSLVLRFVILVILYLLSKVEWCSDHLTLDVNWPEGPLYFGPCLINGCDLKYTLSIRILIVIFETVNTAKSGIRHKIDTVCDKFVLLLYVINDWHFNACSIVSMLLRHFLVFEKKNHYCCNKVMFPHLCLKITLWLLELLCQIHWIYKTAIFICDAIWGCNQAKWVWRSSDYVFTFLINFMHDLHSCLLHSLTDRTQIGQLVLKIQTVEGCQTIGN